MSRSLPFVSTGFAAGSGSPRLSFFPEGKPSTYPLEQGLFRLRQSGSGQLSPCAARPSETGTGWRTPRTLRNGPSPTRGPGTAERPSGVSGRSPSQQTQLASSTGRNGTGPAAPTGPPERRPACPKTSGPRRKLSSGQCPGSCLTTARFRSRVPQGQPHGPACSGHSRSGCPSGRCCVPGPGPAPGRPGTPALPHLVAWAWERGTAPHRQA